MEPYELPEESATFRENWHVISKRPNVDGENKAYALAIVNYIDSLQTTPAN